jgi:hypothetical protein
MNFSAVEQNPPKVSTTKGTKVAFSMFPCLGGRLGFCCAKTNLGRSVAISMVPTCGVADFDVDQRAARPEIHEEVGARVMLLAVGRAWP